MTSSPAGINCGGVCNAGFFVTTDVTLTATPNAGYEFTNWTEGESVVSTSATYTFTITVDRNLRANFQALSTGDLRVSIGTPEAVDAGAQ